MAFAIGGFATSRSISGEAVWSIWSIPGHWHWSLGFFLEYPKRQRDYKELPLYDVPKRSRYYISNKACEKDEPSSIRQLPPVTSFTDLFLVRAFFW